MRNFPLLTLVLTILLVGCGGNADNSVNTTAHQAPPASLQASPPKFTGNRVNYTITKSTNSFIVTKNGGVAVDIGNADAIQFDDMHINLQIGNKANSISALELRSLIDLYVAFFNRVPDADGLAYWIDQFKAGMNLNQIAQSFYSAALMYSAQTGYGVGMTNADFVKLIYKNVLGRSGTTAPSDADVQYWANELKNGRSKSDIIGVMLTSARSFTNDPVWGWVPQLLDNKVVVANYFAVQQGINYNTPEDSISKTMAIVAAITSSSTAAAKTLIGVNDVNFNLSLASDTSRSYSVIAAGHGHSLAIKQDGTLWAWGENFSGELCLGDEIIRTIPTQAKSFSNVVEVAAGFHRSLVLGADGSVWNCGSYSKPAQIVGLTDIVSVSLERSNGYALEKNGTLWQIGLFSNKNVLSGVASMTSGDDYTLALKQDGTVWAIGENVFGQFGFGDTTKRDIFTHASNFDGAITIAAGGNQAFAIRKDGSVQAAGLLWVPLPAGIFTFTTTQSSAVPVLLSSLNNVSKLAIGGGGYDPSHVLALKSDGTVWSWGNSFSGATGLGVMEGDSFQPALVPKLNNIVAISAGGKHSIALKKDGTLWVSGNNASAQLGIGTSTNTFVQVSGWLR